MKLSLYSHLHQLRACSIYDFLQIVMSLMSEKKIEVHVGGTASIAWSYIYRCSTLLPHPLVPSPTLRLNMYTPARPQRNPAAASLSIGTQENAPCDGHGVYGSTQERGRTPGLLNEDVSIAQTPSNNSLSSPESPLCSTSTPKCFQTLHRSPGNAIMDGLGSATSQAPEHPPPFDPYYRQYQGLGINMGSYPPHNSAHVSHYAPPYITSSNSYNR